MSTKPSLWPWFGIVLLTAVLAAVLAAAGCAPAYHAYPCGCVPYGYCPDPPLPYAGYRACPTPWAAKFYREHPMATAENTGNQLPTPDAREPN